MTRAAAFATLFGIGRAPYAPGTAGSLVALPFAWAIAWAAGWPGLLIASIVVALAAIPVSERYARETGRDDPSDCVIDELAAQGLACAFAPRTFLGFALAFVLFRLFDMTKPWPVSAAERLPGGLGIVADDIVAALMAGVIVLLLSRFGVL